MGRFQRETKKVRNKLEWRKSKRMGQKNEKELSIQSLKMPRLDAWYYVLKDASKSSQHTS